MNTFLYGCNDPLAVKKLKNLLNVKYTIHSLENLEKDFDHLELNIKNFKDVPEFSNEGQAIYQKFFNENFTRFNLMIIRRGLFVSDFHDLRDEFSLYFYSFLEIIKKNDIKVIIFFAFPHLGPDYILYKLAKHLGIKTVLVYQSIFENRFFIIPDLRDFGKIKKDININNHESLIQKDKLYLNNAVDWAIKIDGDLSSSYQSFLKSRRKFKFILIKILNFLKITNKNTPQKQQIEYKNNLKKIIIDNKKLDKILNSEKKKIYFPLHFQPELTTSILGNNFDDQVLILERLSRFADNNWDVIVKDNPRQTFYQRGKFFFKRLKYLKNIHFVDSMEDSLTLIKKTDVTATVSGTPGWEAIKNKKKALVFGESWYSGIHGCMKVNENTNNDEINKFINEKFQESKFKSDFNNILSQSYEGVIDLDFIDMFKVKNFNYEQNSEKVVKNILSFIKDKF